MNNDFQGKYEILVNSKLIVIMSYNLFIAFILSAIYVEPLYSDNVKLKYLQFSNPVNLLPEKAINFAIQESGDFDERPRDLELSGSSKLKRRLLKPMLVCMYVCMYI